MHKWLLPKFLIGSVTATGIALLGLIGNVTTVVILVKPQMRTANSFYLTCLAVFDSFLLLTAVLLYPMEYLIELSENVRLYFIWTAYVPYAYAGSHLAQTASVYTTIAVTVERFMATVQPLRSGCPTCGIRGAKLVMTGVFLFSVVFNFGRYWEIGVVERPECEGFASVSLERGRLLLNETYATAYGLWMTSLVMIFGPFIALLVLNSAIVATIQRRSSRKFSGPQWQEKTKNATVVLVVIILIFLVCNVWGFVISLLEYLVGFDRLYSDNEMFYSFSRVAINFLAILNSSVNFYVYCVFGKEFRSEAKSLYTWCWATIFRDKLAILIAMTAVNGSNGGLYFR